MSARRLRLAAALLTLALLLAACGSGDWALQYIAESKGYWTDEGVDVRYVRGQGGSGTLPLAASGTWPRSQPRRSCWARPTTCR
jgi:ABC-type nitrate/sulfonate/bicarbonate transport system substrate-binding protein